MLKRDETEFWRTEERAFYEKQQSKTLASLGNSNRIWTVWHGVMEDNCEIRKEAVSRICHLFSILGSEITSPRTQSC